jgi:hypothetical protein
MAESMALAPVIRTPCRWPQVAPPTPLRASVLVSSSRLGDLECGTPRDTKATSARDRMSRARLLPSSSSRLRRLALFPWMTHRGDASSGGAKCRPALPHPLDSSRFRVPPYPPYRHCDKPLAYPIVCSSSRVDSTCSPIPSSSRASPDGEGDEARWDGARRPRKARRRNRRPLGCRVEVASRARRRPGIPEALLSLSLSHSLSHPFIPTASRRPRHG